MKTDLSEKLRILAESAKYDVSCSSGGVRRRGTDGAPGSTGSWGVCHSFTEDGRCVSLFKIMLTNYCIYDCAYWYQPASQRPAAYDAFYGGAGSD